MRIPRASGVRSLDANATSLPGFSTCSIVSTIVTRSKASCSERLGFASIEIFANESGYVVSLELVGVLIDTSQIVKALRMETCEKSSGSTTHAEVENRGLRPALIDTLRLPGSVKREVRAGLALPI